jgi:hypothetical protein
MQKQIKKIAGVLKHTLALGVVFLGFWPTAIKYLLPLYRGLMGVDSQQLVFYAQEFSRRFVLPPAGWKMSWFEGTAVIDDIPWLNFYLIQPLVAWLGAFAAVKVYFVGFLFLFLLFSYLVFYEVSGSVLLSMVLGVALSRSWAVYTQLYDAGVGLSSLAQVAFPATLFFLLKYNRKRQARFLGWAVLALAFGFLTHDLLAIFFIILPLVLFLALSFYPKENFLSWAKIKRILFFSLGALLVSLPAWIFHFVDFFIGTSVRGNLGQAPQPQGVGFAELFKTTNWVFLVAFPLVFLVGLLFSDRKKRKVIGPLLAILLYFLLFQASYALVINPLVAVLFPHRSFWLFPLMLGVLVAAFLGQVRLKGKGRLILVWSVAILVLIGSFWRESIQIKPGIRETVLSLFQDQENWSLDPEPIENRLGREFEKKIDSLEKVETGDLNHRAYTYNAGVRILWNGVFGLPQTHGYWHYFTPRSVNWLAWLYGAFSRDNFDQFEKGEGGIPTDVARRQSLFLADWYATRYFLTFASKEEEVAPHFYEENDYVLAKTATQAPAIVEFSPAAVSEIARPANQPVWGFVGDDQSYDYLLRNLGIMNFNSQKLIPIRLANFVEDLGPEDWQGIDGLIFYNYRKKGNGQGYQAGWGRVREFVEQGGVVLMETGAECPEKWGEAIPGVFPILKLDSGSLGKSWRAESDFFGEVDFEELAPLSYQDSFWGVSYALGSDFVKPGAEVLLTQANRPVVVKASLGQGKVIWSGLNLFYRPLHHQEKALAETQLLGMIIKDLTPFSQARVDFDFSRPEHERLSLVFEGAKGALFKENNYGGWSAWAEVNGRKRALPILGAGPDFMYAPLPEELVGQRVKVEWRYRGIWHHWLTWLVSLVAFVFVLDLTVLKQRIFNFFYLPFKKRALAMKKAVKEKWEDEEEVS